MSHILSFYADLELALEIFNTNNLKDLFENVNMDGILSFVRE